MSWIEGPVPSGFDPIAADPDLVWAEGDNLLAGWGSVVRIEVPTGANRAGAAVSELHESLDPGPWTAFFSLTFDRNRTGSVLVVPSIMFESNREGTRLIHHETSSADIQTQTETEPDRPRFAGSSLPDLLWMEAVAEAIKTIERGDAEKICMARDLAVWSERPFQSRRLVRRLRRRFPDCFTYLVEGLVGSFPELLARRNGNLVESVAIAGSAARSSDPEQDRRLGEDLLSSKKDLHEHQLTADSVVSVLGDLCTGLDSSGPTLLRLDNIHHLLTSFTGSLTEPIHLLELVDRMHPTAAVGGTPTEVALTEITRLEGMDRDRYAGPVGWFDHMGNGEGAIALRCAQLSGARARLFAGNGIVKGSLPEAELEETRVKLLAMMGALEY